MTNVPTLTVTKKVMTCLFSTSQSSLWFRIDRVGIPPEGPFPGFMGPVWGERGSQRPDLPRLRAGTRVRGPCLGLPSEEGRLARGLVPFLVNSFPSLFLVLPVSQGAGLASGFVGDGGSAAFHTEAQELGLFPPLLHGTAF